MHTKGFRQLFCHLLSLLYPNRKHEIIYFQWSDKIKKSLHREDTIGWDANKVQNLVA